jgi:hypothetical protein
MAKNEDAYYRNRSRIIAFHRALRILHLALLSKQMQGITMVPPPLFSSGGLAGGDGGGGAGMRDLARVLVFRGALPVPWIGVLNFPVPFPMQARTGPRAIVRAR